MSLCAPWVLEDDLPCDLPDSNGSGAGSGASDGAIVQRAIWGASYVLYRLSGSQYGGACDEIIRPTCKAHIHQCQCGGVSEITLGREPILDIAQVRVDGQIVNPALYRVDDASTLVRLPDLDGYRARWPCWQRMDLAATEQDTFEVSFSWGSEPPEIGVIAAIDLACELVKAQTPGTDCEIQDKTTTITRQGVSMTIVDPSAFLKDGKTGMHNVDLFLAAVNPGRTTTGGGVLNPDLLPTGRHTG